MKVKGAFAGALVLVIAFVNAAAQDTDVDEEPVITLARTSAYGSSIVIYSVAIYKYGRVVFDHRDKQESDRLRTALITPAQVESLVRRFYEVGYFSFRDVYRYGENPDGTLSDVSHASTTLTSINWNGQKKRVANRLFGPPELHELEYEIERVVNTHQWLHPEDDLKVHSMVASDVLSRRKPGLTPLMQAAGQRDEGVLEKLILAGGDVNARDETGWTALMIAAAMCEADSVGRLLEAQADVHAYDHNGDTALIAVAAGRWLNSRDEWQTQILAALLRAGAHVHTRNKGGQTALMWAARSGNPEAVRVLLRGGAVVHEQDRFGKSALDYARETSERFKDHDRVKHFRQVVEMLETPTLQ